MTAGAHLRVAELAHVPAFDLSAELGAMVCMP